MPDKLSSLSARILGRLADLWAWPIAILGIDTSGLFQALGCSAPVAATGTLTFVANASNGDTFTIGGQTYRTMTTPAQAYDVDIGATAAATLDNIKLAVNADGDPGATTFYTGTLPNKKVSATTNTDTTQLFEAIEPGAQGNLIGTTETFTNAGNVFGATTLTGGTNAVQQTVAAASSVVMGKVRVVTANGDEVTDDTADAVKTTFPIPQAVSTYSPSSFENLGANATLNVKASAGNVFSLTCHNENASDRYIQLHNTATTPGGAAAPVESFLIPAGAQIVIGTDYFTEAGTHFATGIAFAFSTTKDTYTAGTAGDHTTRIKYK